MVNNKRRFIGKRWIILVFTLLFLHFYQLPFYYTEPGDLKVLATVVDVDNGYAEQGSFMLTTVKLGRANAFFYAWAHLSEFRELIPEEQMKGPDETDEDYFHRQQMMMSSSQEAAKIVAYQKAGKQLEFEHNGVLVMAFIDGMPAAKVLQPSDRILGVDGESIQTVTQLNELVGKKEAGEQVLLTVNREDKIIDVYVTIDYFPEELGGGEGRFGLGIMNPITDRQVTYNPEVTIDVRQVGGPSAGLMFSLEVYNQLIPEDITKGYAIAGTGTINESGRVGRIGGAKQKVMAAHQANADIFFVPNEEGRENSNYNEAIEAANIIGTNMKIVAVDSFEDAISYLEHLPKKGE